MPKTFNVVKIWAKSLKIRAKSVEIWAKCMKTQTFFHGDHVCFQFFSAKLGKIWAKMVLEVP